MTCRVRVGSGRKGWRLPSVDELTTLLLPKPFDPTVTPALPPGHPFDLSNMAPGVSVWSSTADPSAVYVVGLAQGNNGGHPARLFASELHLVRTRAGGAITVSSPERKREAGFTLIELTGVIAARADWPPAARQAGAARNGESRERRYDPPESVPGWCRVRANGGQMAETLRGAPAGSRLVPDAGGAGPLLDAIYCAA